MDTALRKWMCGVKGKKQRVQQQLIELQTILRKFPSLKTEHLTCCILDEALRMPEHQNNYLNVLRHLVLAQKVPSSDILLYITRFKDYSHTHHVKVLLDLAHQMVKPLWFHPGQDIVASCCCLLRLLHWLVAYVHTELLRVQSVSSLASLAQRRLMPGGRRTDTKAGSEQQLSNLRAAQALMQELMHGRKGILHGLLRIGSAELPEVSTDLVQTARVSMDLIYRAPQTTIPSDLQEALLQSNKDCQRLEGALPRVPQPRESSGSPSCLVQGLVAMATHLLTRSDQQDLLRQLDVLRSHLLMTWEEMVTELLGVCFEGLQQTQHSAERRAEWIAFTFLAIPQMLTWIRDDYSVEELPAYVEKAVGRIMTLYTVFEETEMSAGTDTLSLFLCELRLYKIISPEQQKNLQEAKSQMAGSLSGRAGSSINQAAASMLASTPHVVEFLQVKNYLPQVQQTVAYSCERMMELGHDAKQHHQKVGLVLGTMLQMKTFHFPILAFTGELTNFVQILFRVHDTARQQTFPPRQGDVNWTELFDTSFILFSALAMDLGSQVILDCREEKSMQCRGGGASAYVWWWLARGLPWAGKVQDDTQMGSQSPADEVLLACLAQRKPLPAGYAPFDKLCWSIPKVMEEMLNAFIYDAISLEVLQGTLTQLSMLPCSLLLVAGVWLCSHASQMAEEERARPLQMLDCLLSLPAPPQHRAELVAVTRELLQRVAMPLCLPHRPPLPPSMPPADQLSQALLACFSSNLLHPDCVEQLRELLTIMGPNSFMQCSVRELVEWRVPERSLLGAVHVVLAVLHLSLRPLTLSLLDTVLPRMLATSGVPQVPDFLHARVLAHLTVAAVVANHSCVQDSLGKSEEEEKGSEKEDKDEEEEEEAESKWKDPVSRSLCKLLRWLGQVAGCGEESPRMDFTGALLAQLSLCQPHYTQHFTCLLPRDMVQQVQVLCDRSLSAGQVLALSDLGTLPGREAAARAVWQLRHKENQGVTRPATHTATVPVVSRSALRRKFCITEFGLNGVVTR